MGIELEKAGLSYEKQKGINVSYDGKVAGDFIADLIVEDAVIVELKSVRSITEAHEVQLVNYLVATGKPLGLIINFGEKEVEVRRRCKDLESVFKKS